MSPKKKKKLILSLIKDDLINSKLVIGLEQIGLEALPFCLHLSGTIFDLMGFEDNERNDEIYSEYITITKRALTIDISKGNNTLDELATETYQFLLKNSRKKK